ncbi:NAD(P)-dependent dehydrogenase (short-subunit alcohol dehydrogenase family) [Nocardia transvalensis]|uniref:NAD(P)-dependent dehydrogenase (Short-subunit alcohol dehydrogenase family) n=1 Tax=Nocardia transvalensis TaxID=37333 RepID=A0A7W9UJV9_9NOCA|nr:SDR family oxidoreductase [Nocardia transvalensis]MBB5915075.1 NAD(P)-dependent dehydrogenase (short-subunit alcohol dehydrogenase family) [Nocardia transvalensis]
MDGKRSALVTGGSRGIGAEIARRLAAEGHTVTIAARTADTLERTAQRLRSETGGEVHPVVANMADPDQVAALVDAHADRCGGMDLLVLSAGTGTASPVAEMTDRARERMLDVNFRAPLTLIRAALPLLRASAAADPHRGAKIVAIASITGVAGEPGLAAYGATKAALISLCETVSLEESARGVSATALSPGYVDTDMSAWKHGDLAPDAMLPTADIAELVLAVSRLSARAVVPNIVVSRAGDQLWRA